MGQEVVDLAHQRLQLQGHAGIQLAALALLQLGDLPAHPLQRAQGAAHGIALQGEHQQQGGSAQGDPRPLHATEAVEDGRVVLSHGDAHLAAEAAVVTTIGQQLLVVGAGQQLGGEAGPLGHGELSIPEGARAPGFVIDADQEVAPRIGLLVHRVELLFVQLDAVGPAHQGGQQAFRLAAQVAFQVAAQAVVEQPQADLSQQQPDHQQQGHQADAELALDGPHSVAPVKR